MGMIFSFLKNVLVSTMIVAKQSKAKPSLTKCLKVPPYYNKKPLSLRFSKSTDQPGTSRSRLPPYGTLSIENWQVFYGPSSVIRQINVTCLWSCLPYIEICPSPHLPSHWMHGAWFCVGESLSSPQAFT
jgi:hypothetical protein